MVLTEDPPPAGQSVLGQGAGPLVFAQLGQVVDDAAGRDKRIGVIVTEDPPEAGQGVLGQGAGPLVLTQLSQAGGEVAS